MTGSSRNGQSRRLFEVDEDAEDPGFEHGVVDANFVSGGNDNHISCLVL